MTGKTLEAIQELKTACEHIMYAHKLLDEQGVIMSSFYVSPFFPDEPIVHLSRGINTISEDTGIEVKTHKYDINEGVCLACGIEFKQNKIPVEREDRYA